MKIFFVLLVLLLFSILVHSGEKPRLWHINVPSDIKLGQKVTLQCISLQGTPPIHYEWYHNGELIKNGTEYMLEYYPALNSKALTIKSASVERNGNYTCIASNTYGKDQITNYIGVKGPPFWIQKPENEIIAILGKNITLKCNIGGYPHPKIEWFRTDSNLWLAEGNFYEITKVAKSKSGIYECQARNGIGSTLKHAFHLKITAMN